MKRLIWQIVKSEVKAFVWGFATALLLIFAVLWLSGQWPCRGACGEHVNPPRHVEVPR